MLEKLCVGFLDTNCYILGEDELRQAVVIDPGGDLEMIEQKLSRLKLDLKYILLTHGHPDHCQAAKELSSRTKAPVLLHPADSELFGLKSDQPLSEKEKIKLGSLELEVIHTPGHTPGSVCFKSRDSLFSGDTLFKGGVGRTDLPGGDTGLLKAALKKIKTLPPQLKVYPGHGPESSLQNEFSQNPFFNEDWW